MKSLYRHKRSKDIFAIETDDKGNILSTSGPLLTKDLNLEMLDYDDYWNTKIKAKIKDFEIITKEDYLEILRKNGFVIQSMQKHLFGYLEE